jgi:hypothetical protein
MIEKKYVYVVKYQEESPYSPPEFYCLRDITNFLIGYEEEVLHNCGGSYNFFKAIINKPNSWQAMIEFDDFIDELYYGNDDLDMLKYLDTPNDKKYKNESKYFNKIWNNLKVKIKKYKPCSKLDNIDNVYICKDCELVTDKKINKCECANIKKISLD